MEDPQISSISAERRFDIDWLRVILFGLLIPFHVSIGLLWNAYGTNFNPVSNVGTNTSLVLGNIILLWMHQWRLPALFMISGIGTAFAFRRRNTKTFIKERFSRLVVPLLFGMFIVNLIYWWLSFYSSTDTYFQSSPVGWFIGVTIFIWILNLAIFPQLSLHLWFLVNLFMYSIMAAPILSRVTKKDHGLLIGSVRRIIRLPFGVGILILIPLPLLLAEIIFKPYLHGHTGHGYEFWWYLVFFLLGFFLISAKEDFYNALSSIKVTVTILAFITSVAFILFITKTGELTDLLLNGSWALRGFPVHNSLTLLAIALHSYHAWFWCLVLFSWGAYFLNKPSKYLTSLNQGVYPFYILHMSFIFIGLFLFRDLGLSLSINFILITAFTLFGCWLSFRLVVRTRLTRLLFGIKEIQSTEKGKCDKKEAQLVVFID